MSKILLTVEKEQVEKVLGFKVKHFSLHPEYVNGECIGLEIDVIPEEEKIKIPLKVFIEKNRL